jgi:transcriptional regulator with XRE-family HTH domain
VQVFVTGASGHTGTVVSSAQPDNEFGALLRTFRERLSPETAGIGPTWPPVRRVSGLRRDELAELAGVSEEHLKRLEQGRRHPSKAMVDALARALRLDPHEHAQLRLLAGFAVPDNGPALPRVPPEAPQNGLLPEEGGREVLERGFRVLRALPDADQGRQAPSNGELTSTPRSTVHQLLLDLRRSGTVELPADGRGAVSPQRLEMTGQATRFEFDGARTALSRVIQDLREETGATVSLVLRAEASFLALELVPGPEELPIDAFPGVNIPDRTAAAAVVLHPRHQQSLQRRPFAAVVDEQNVFEGVTRCAGC